MKKLYIIIIASLLIFSCSSCGFVHRISNKNKQHHQRTEEKKLDSTGTTKTDSVHATSSDSTGVKKQDSTGETKTTIIFQDSSDHNTIEIKPDGTIKATGKIKSVETKAKHSKAITDSTSQHLNTSTTKQTSSTAAVKSIEKKKTVDDTKTNTSRVTKFQLPWYAYVIFIFFFLLIIVVYRYRNKIKSFIKQVRSLGNGTPYD